VISTESGKSKKIKIYKILTIATKLLYGVLLIYNQILNN